MYLRKSRQDEEIINATIDETLEKHEKLLRDYAERAQIDINGVYKEVASAGDIENRPVFNQLLLDIEQGLFEAVLVVDIDRLTRGNAVDLERIKNTFKIKDCKIITPLKIYDPQNDDDEFFLDFNMFISARELRLIRKRMMRGKIAAMEQGLYTGSVLPLGYTKVKNENGKGWILYPKEDEAKIVRYIFEQYANGARPADIIHFLNKNGMRGKRGAEWTHRLLKRIVNNRNYIGEIAMQRRTTIQTIENGTVKKRLVMNKDVQHVKGKHQPLISKELWDIVQDRQKIYGVDRVTRTTEMKNPFSGLIFCEHCGRTMARKPHFYKESNRRVIYLCCSTLRCPTAACEFPLVEERILSELHKELDNFNIFLDNYAEEYEIRKENNQKELEILNENLTKRQNMLVRACEMLEEGIYTPEMFKARQSEINGQIEHIKSCIEEVNSRSEHSEVEVVRKLVPNIKLCLDEYHNLTPKEQNKLLKSIIERVTYSRKQRAQKNTPKDDFELDIKLRI